MYFNLFGQYKEVYKKEIFLKFLKISSHTIENAFFPPSKWCLFSMKGPCHFKNVMD